MAWDPGPVRTAADMRHGGKMEIRKVYICPICDSEMINVRCKLLCNNCGYREDCSDLFSETAENPEPTDADTGPLE